jgi:hypothetical protein
MAGKIEQIVIVTLSEDIRYHKKGVHAMNVKVAEKLKDTGAKMTTKPAKEVIESLISKVKAKREGSIEAQEKAQKAK